MGHKPQSPGDQDAGRSPRGSIPLPRHLRRRGSSVLAFPGRRPSSRSGGPLASFWRLGQHQGADSVLSTCAQAGC
eukprot:12309130-Heterocapsa_arctica.AAC.1